MTKGEGRVPVISSADEFSIPWQTLQTIIAGWSLIDRFELQVANLDEARRSLKAYGLGDSDDPEGLRRIAREYIEIVLLADSELCLSQALRELSLAQLLVTASIRPRTTVCAWSSRFAMLSRMHCGHGTRMLIGAR